MRDGSTPDDEEITRPLEVVDQKAIEHANIQAVAFDFDDTVVCLPVSWQSVMADLFVEVLLPTAPAAERSRAHASFTSQIEARSGTPLTVLMDWLRVLARGVGHATPRPVSEYRDVFDARWQLVADNLHRPEHVPAGLRALAAELSGLGVQLYVVTGGDLQHKRRMLRQLELGDVLPEQHVFGDKDPGVGGTRFTKRAALAEIDLAVRAVIGNHVGAASPVVALIGDSEHDMREAQAAGALAVGYRQRSFAHAVITGAAFPTAAEFARHIPVRGAL
ncbi:MAG: HAD family hydrolase [Sciscionella sp.]